MLDTLQLRCRSRCRLYPIMQAGLLERDEELCGLYEQSAALQKDIDAGGRMHSCLMMAYRPRLLAGRL